MVRISDETGIGLDQLEAYLTGEAIQHDDAILLAYYFETNTHYLNGLWDIPVAQRYLSRFQKFFQDKDQHFIPDFDEVFKDPDNCFYNFWIQALKSCVLTSNTKAKHFFDSLTLHSIEDKVYISIPDDVIIDTLKSYNRIIRYHYPSGGRFTPIQSFKGQVIEREESQKTYVVRSGRCYFANWDEVRAVVVLDDMVGFEDYVAYFDTQEEALSIAIQLGWEIEEVSRREEKIENEME
ncbi:hypothetical protein [Streptococcus suis]